ncbi:hypothetical protein CV102_11860 [Natronococcus pandeyae]|uniref:Uncharacterized protein n=1 Tax=Natronococcus pandeyae TaxID=2055836 RepID=A0A8J8Q750_9EURY|nr:hypothetical protein CV102_11860 [Natronococcus pandeyae]
MRTVHYVQRKSRYPLHGPTESGGRGGRRANERDRIRIGIRERVRATDRRSVGDDIGGRDRSRCRRLILRQNYLKTGRSKPAVTADDGRNFETDFSLTAVRQYNETSTNGTRNSQRGPVLTRPYALRPAYAAGAS